MPAWRKITGYKIDIYSETQIAQERLSSLGLTEDMNETAGKEKEEEAAEDGPATEDLFDAGESETEETTAEER